MIFEFEVKMVDVGVPVWRKIQVDSEHTFNELHEILQVAFEWENSHLYKFFVKRTHGEQPDTPVSIEPKVEVQFFDESFIDTYDDREEILSDWFQLTKDRAVYMYDFGDDWHHEITLLRILKPEKDVQYPRCIDALNLAPEEDSRFEVISGTAKLEFANKKTLVKEINEEFKNDLPNLFTTVKQNALTKTFEDILVKAKEFHKLKPWEKLSEDEFFVVEDPKTGVPILCSVMGSMGDVYDTYGIKMYVGATGIQTALDTMNETGDESDLYFNERSIVLSFENRDDLEKQEYQLIKSNDISFRGKKAWPAFTSYKPGYWPWSLDEEEIRLAYFALDQAIEVYKNVENVFNPQEGKVLARIPQKTDEQYLFESEWVQLADLVKEDEGEEIPLAVSELEVKRLTKQLKRIPITVEFGFDFIDYPFEDQPNLRPIFPLIVLAVESKNKQVEYQNLVRDHELDTLQNQFLNMLEELEGIPEKMFMDAKTARIMSPLIKKFNINVQTEGYQPTIKKIIEEILGDN
ncbi:plasmid pRiA4b ORF-3 family protein [Ornithinibacillus halophilus]|uniref:PRiA4b ORF-3-like protein n=1 Tax=Ornithinibacillus halophilus TaxID=930117 RepID=A0A1M5K429_9BACI|nr:plasmid pRiA4b ORF-3 family protein [Ornithinibacillus halophilus]SHG47515.1 pRiA4b ORF-3-like protein [Ornithinibacillus halophilus]